MRLSNAFKSADGHTLYAIDENGARRRVRFDGPKLVPLKRPGKARRKAEKKARRRA